MKYIDYSQSWLFSCWPCLYVHSGSIWCVWYLMLYQLISWSLKSMRLSDKPLASIGNLTHWARDKMAAIFQTIFSSVFSMKMYEFRLTFHWSMFLGVQLTIFQHWVQVMVWRRPGDKPLSEPMMVILPTHICVTRPQWVNCFANSSAIMLIREIRKSQFKYCNFWDFPRAYHQEPL